jgi:NADPH:quinone reductase-like Zn-dependent oxidoreductase
MRPSCHHSAVRARLSAFAVQLAKALGAAHVTGVCSTAKMPLVCSLGADQVVDYTKDDFADAGTRYDLILDTAGNRPLHMLRRALTPTGTLVIVGGEGGGDWTGGFERWLRAALLSPFVGQQLKGLMAVEGQSDLRILTEIIEAGSVTPVIDRSYALAEAPAAIQYVHEGRAHGKVVVMVGGSAPRSESRAIHRRLPGQRPACY